MGRSKLEKGTPSSNRAKTSLVWLHSEDCPWLKGEPGAYRCVPMVLADGIALDIPGAVYRDQMSQIERE